MCVTKPFQEEKFQQDSGVCGGVARKVAQRCRCDSEYQVCDELDTHVIHDEDSLYLEGVRLIYQVCYEVLNLWNTDAGFTTSLRCVQGNVSEGVTFDDRRWLYLTCNQALICDYAHVYWGTALSGVQLSKCSWLPLSETHMDRQLLSSMMKRMCVEVSSLQEAFIHDWNHRMCVWQQKCDYQ